MVELPPREHRQHLGRPSPSSETRSGTRAPRAVFYTVQRGDSLSSIAKKELGNQNRWREIQVLNGLRGSIIAEGQKLRMPNRESSRSAPQTRLREVEVESREYVVQRGDSLGGIAQKELGGESRWREIQSLNGIGGTTIRPGQKLLLPSR